MVVIVCALAGELQNLNALITGVGKVNAALTLTRFLAETKVSAVVNLGSAGGVGIPQGALVQVSEIHQWDMRCEGLEFPRGQTPFDNVPACLHSSYEVDLEGLEEAPCYTSDRFLDDPVQLPPGRCVVDMEAFALAKVCNAFSVPFTSIKYVTDNADKSAGETWHEALPGCVNSLSDVAKHVLKV